MDFTDSGEQQRQVEILKEMVAHNLEYKATIHQADEPENFEVNIYHWREQEDAAPVWERIGGPFLMPDFAQAEASARQQLDLFAGETKDPEISEDMATWLREYSGDPEAEFLSPANFEIKRQLSENEESEYEELDATHVVIVHEMYLVESGQEWMLGVLEREGIISCWESFFSLEEALDALLMSEE